LESIEKLNERYVALKEEYSKLKNNKNITQEEKLILNN
jgi:hypothetical protein